MTTYRFCVAPGGTLVCYKVNNGFIKFTGSYAQQLLEHIKDFSFYTFYSNIKKDNNNKHTYDLAFDSNNHHVVFEDINNLKTKESISIEKEIKDLVNIVKENNNIQKENEQKIKKQSLLKTKLKALLYATTLSTAMLVSTKENVDIVKAETNDDILNNNNQIAQTAPVIPASEITTNDLTALTLAQSYTGQILTKSLGVLHNGPAGGDETYYDKKMDRVVRIMRDKGFDELNYPYWVREDGVKMLGSFVMVAANLEVHPRGSIVQTSLGTGLVCDTGAFAKTNKLKLDIATSWTKGI